MRFTPEEADFIRTQLGIQVSAEENEERVLEEIWEAACEVEIEESNQLEELTEKGKMAVSLVTKLSDQK